MMKCKQVKKVVNPKIKCEITLELKKNKLALQVLNNVQCDTILC